MKRFLIVFLILLGNLCFAQLKPLGSWTAHLPYRVGTSIAINDGLIYCGTNTGLFTYDTQDNSISTFSKVNLLNDVSISKIAYSNESQTLVIVYANGNIDLIRSNVVTNIPFIRSSNESPKTINELSLDGRFAYLSMGFGIVKLDLEKQEIVDTYKFGPGGNSINVLSTSVFNNRVYAGTNSGVFSANQNSNLLDFNSWSRTGLANSRPIKKLFKFNGNLGYIVKTELFNDSTFLFNGQQRSVLNALTPIDFKSIVLTENQNSLSFTTNTSVITVNDSYQELETISIQNSQTLGTAIVNNKLFLLDNSVPLAEIDQLTGDVINSVKPNGPLSRDIFDMDMENGKLWAVNGGHDFSYNNANRNTLIYSYEDGVWENYQQTPELNLDGAYDLLSVTIDPENENNVFFGAWGKGLYRYNNKGPFILYRDTNSSLNDRPAWRGWVGTGEGAFDDDGNFWTTNTYNKKALSVLKKNGLWKFFDFSDLIALDETVVYDLLIDDNGYKWIVLPRANSIIVFDDNGTIDNEADDRSIRLTSVEGQGNIPGSRGIKLEKDKDGTIWMGTSDGISVHFNPSRVFEEGQRDFQRIIFFDGENNSVVLQNTAIKDIAIDGANRKWIGTETGGVLLLSEDGKETLLRFTESNSPLLSNSINAITLDDETGEVYIATGNGLQSYRGNSTKETNSFAEVSIFPNPVRTNVDNTVTMQGLVGNSTIKITDVNGSLVNEVSSDGGTAVWNTRNFNGEQVPTGVYLLFLSGEDEDGDLQTEVGKVMIIN